MNVSVAMVEEELDWVEKVKSEGAVPVLEAGKCSSGWGSPSGNIFMVRGKDYLRTKAKVRGGDYLLKPLGFDWIKGPTKISEVLNNPRGRVRRRLEAECSKGKGKPFVWAFNFQLPNKDNCSIVAYFVSSTETVHQNSLINQFLKGDDEFKNSRLKLIANVAKGPWIVKKAVGEQAICVIGRTLTCHYSMGENFIQVDIDVGSSMLATAVTHLALAYITTLTIDLAFLIEAQTETELPERLLGALTFSHIDPAAATQLEELPYDGSPTSLHSSLPNRLWKKLGDGISHLIHPHPQHSHDSNDTTTTDAHNP
ncbi:hypothetical protein ACS0TY_023889 [Phlomoides rotata]